MGPFYPRRSSKHKGGSCHTESPESCTFQKGRDKEWNTKALKQIFNKESVTAISKISWRSFTCSDKLIWTSDRKGRFSVSNCYLTNFGGHQTEESFWSKLWKLNIHERLKVFLWRVANDILPTKDIIDKRIIRIDVECSVCGEGRETLNHLFKECYFARLVAFGSKWGIRLEEWNNRSVQEILEDSMSGWSGSVGYPKQKFGTVIIGSLFVCLWKHRNQMVYGRGQKIEDVVAGFERAVEEFKDLYDKQETKISPLDIIWDPPAPGEMKINTRLFSMEMQCWLW